MKQLRLLLLLLFFTTGCAADSNKASRSEEDTSTTSPDTDTPTNTDGDTDSSADTDSQLVEICNESHPSWTVGLKKCLPGTSPGYTLFAPISSTTTYLIDVQGRLVHSWPSIYQPGLAVYLLDNGDILRTAKTAEETPFISTGGVGGAIQRISWDGEVMWEFVYANADHHLHHDIEPLPNGNVLAIAWEHKTTKEATDAGRDPDTMPQGALWPDTVIEIAPSGTNGGEIVWEWKVWDHLVQDYDDTLEHYAVVSDSPGLVDLNYMPSPKPDWNHLNAVAYNQDLDQILLSSHNQSEIWIIDHGTSILEAAGHSGGAMGKGGDILYRWGNPAVYRAGTMEDQRLFNQHDAHWIAEEYPGEGNILVFNNGKGRPTGDYSTVDELKPPVLTDGSYQYSPGSAFDPAAPDWSYMAPTPLSFFASTISGAARMPGGTTLICEGPRGHFFEVMPDGEVVWEYVNPVAAIGPLTQGTDMSQGKANHVFRARRYPPEHPAFEGKDLTPGDYIELPAK